MALHSCESLERIGSLLFKDQYGMYGSKELIHIDDGVTEWIEEIRDLFSHGFFDQQTSRQMVNLCGSLFETGSVMNHREILRILRDQIRGRKKIFISHSEKNDTCATNFMKLLIDLGVHKKFIYKANEPKEGMKLTKDVISSLKNEFEGNIDIVCILSEDYFKSAYCMNEAGAAWCTGKRLFKVYISGFDYHGEKGVLQGMGKGVRIVPGDSEMLAELVGYFIERYCDGGTHRGKNFEKMVNDFIEKANEEKPDAEDKDPCDFNQ